MVDMKDTLDLRTVGAILLGVKGEINLNLEITHATVDNRRKKVNDASPLTERWLFDTIRRDEQEMLKVCALRRKRLEYLIEYRSRHGKKPSPDMIRKITLTKETDNEQQTTNDP